MYSFSTFSKIRYTEFYREDITSIKLSTMRGGEKFYVLYSYNPPSAVRNWCNMEFRQAKTGRKFHQSDYRGVPKDWLGDAFIAEAEDMKMRNLRAYENVFLGLPTGTGRNIFENLEIREITQKEIDSFDYIYCGVDWGYFPDPFAFGAMSYDAKKHTLYIFAELYLYKHGNYEAFLETKAFMEKIGLSITSDRITADSAEPKSCNDFVK